MLQKRVPANDRIEADVRLELAMDIAGLGTFALDLSTETLSFSERAAEIYGQDATTPWGEWVAGVHAEDLSDIETLRSRLVSDTGLSDCRTSFRYVRRDGAERYVVKRCRVERDRSGAAIRVIGVIADETDRRAQELRSSWLLAQLQHRVKNVMAMVRSLARRTLENSSDLEGYFSHFDGRLNALARVQSALARRVDEGIEVEELVREELLQYAVEDEQLNVAGPMVRLHGPAAEYIALALHELAVNAVKFGALSGQSGMVDVEWELRGGHGSRQLRLCWSERGVPLVATNPGHMGFGRQLIEQGLPYQLGAQATFKLEAGGVRCELEVSLEGGGG